MSKCWVWPIEHTMLNISDSACWTRVSLSNMSKIKKHLVTSCAKAKYCRTCWRVEQWRKVCANHSQYHPVWLPVNGADFLLYLINFNLAHQSWYMNKCWWVGSAPQIEIKAWVRTGDDMAMLIGGVWVSVVLLQPAVITELLKTHNPPNESHLFSNNYASQKSTKTQHTVCYQLVHWLISTNLHNSHNSLGAV